MLNSLDAIGSVTQTVTSGSLFSRDSAGARSWPYFVPLPCVLPLVPGYLSYITGLTGAEIASEDGHLDARGRSRIVIGCTLFVAGFSVVFIALGAAFGAVSGWLLEYQTTIQRVLGLVVIVMGLMFGAGSLACNGVAHPSRAHVRAVGSTPVGLPFGLGWTPCIGPTLSAVLSLAVNEGSAIRGAILSLAYCVGLGNPVRHRGTRIRPGCWGIEMGSKPLLADHADRRRHVGPCGTLVGDGVVGSVDHHTARVGRGFEVPI